MKNIEIMAPAGSRESLMAAINAGAGSVYFGVERLNMRSKSSANFTLDDLRDIVSICDSHNVKSYLTMNIVIYDEEIEVMKETLDVAKREGVTAVIASDMAVMEYARQIELEVHISTQANVSNFHALRFYAQYADVVVLARELSIEQIAYIHEKIVAENVCGPSGDLVEIELFVHGAMCMSVSSKCYLSLHEKGYSANRGACLQNCRKEYTVADKETGYQLDIDNGYIMSHKDMCTIEIIDKIIETGATVLKLEGRARSPEYVKTVVECYKKAVEAYNNNEFTFEYGTKLKSELENVFNRGFWEGHYLGHPTGEWSDVYGSKAKERKMYVGKVTNYFSNIGVVEVLLQAGELNDGEKLLFMGPTTGVVVSVVDKPRVDLKETHKVCKGELFSMKINAKLRRNDKLYKIVPA